MYLVKTTLCGMNNATPLCVTHSPSEMDNAIFSSSEMDNATPSPCGMDNATPSPCTMAKHYGLESITPAITTVSTLLLWVFVSPE